MTDLDRVVAALGSIGLVGVPKAEDRAVVVAFPPHDPVRGMVVTFLPDEQLVVLVHLRATVPPAKRTEVSALLHELNWDLSMGCFQLHPQQGELRFRLGQRQSTAISPAAFLRHLGFIMSAVSAGWKRISGVVGAGG